jgi:hypothetical protein
MAEYAKPSRAVNTVVAGRIILAMDRLGRSAPRAWRTLRRNRSPAAIAITLAVLCPNARAQSLSPGPGAGSLPTPGDTARPGGDVGEAAPHAAAPPPLNVTYLQYGVSFTGEFVASAGPMCKDAGVGGNAPCIFGSGGGVAIRVGYRSAGPWYLGGAYELSKQDPSQLYRLAILQQLRGEARYYVPTGWDASPFGSAGVGVAVYGNEGAIDTFAPSVFAAIGAEAQLSRRVVVGVAVAYRALYFTRFTDSSGTSRSAGIANVVGLDLSLEARDPL